MRKLLPNSPEVGTILYQIELQNHRCVMASRESFSHLGRKAGSGSDGQLFCWTVRANGYQTQVNVSRPNHHLQWDHVVHLITRMVKGNTLFNGTLEIHSRLKIFVSWLAFCQQACREEVELIVIDTNSYWIPVFEHVGIYQAPFPGVRGPGARPRHPSIPLPRILP